MKNDELLITKLIEETCKEETEEVKTDNRIDLASYFEKKVNQVEFLSIPKYIEQNHLHSVEMEYNQTNKCFRVKLKETELDFPSNWSVFAIVKNSEVVFVDKETDTDFLCDVIAELESTCESFMLVNDSGNFKLIKFDDVDGKSHYEWVKDYFENKREKEFYKKAA